VAEEVAHPQKPAQHASFRLLMANVLQQDQYWALVAALAGCRAVGRRWALMWISP
jgi:hypothetical protein